MGRNKRQYRWRKRMASKVQLFPAPETIKRYSVAKELKHVNALTPAEKEEFQREFCKNYRAMIDNINLSLNYKVHPIL